MVKLAESVKSIKIVKGDYYRKNLYKDEEDDCSIFKRLTRKCHCLNHTAYNDFIIHFNEDTKYFTSTLGEIIKNIRILKKFLYMGGGYTKNALMFLNEGLSTDSSHQEKVEIIQACSYADICNVFDETSLVTVCILWPCWYDNYGDPLTQMLAAGFLYKLSRVEEGRRYLNFTSKITNDIKRLLRKKSANLNTDVSDSLNSTLNLLNPPLTQHINVTYYCKAEEGMGYRIINALLRYRTYLTLDEVFTHLELLNKMSGQEAGKKELFQYLPSMLNVFKHVLMEYDNNEMNIVIVNILNNMVSKNTVTRRPVDIQKAFIMSDMSTEPVDMKHAMIQAPSRKNCRLLNKSRVVLGASTISTRLEPPKRLSKHNVRERGPPKAANKPRKDVIVVPVKKAAIKKAVPVILYRQ